MSGKTVKICLGLQLETNGIELRTFKTISDEEILAQKLQSDKRKELLIHHFIAKYLKSETAEWFKRTWKATGAVSQQLKPISAQTAGVPLLFFCPQPHVSHPSFMRHQRLQRGIDLVHWVESGRNEPFFCCLVSFEPAGSSSSESANRAKYSSASARH